MKTFVRKQNFTFFFGLFDTRSIDSVFFGKETFTYTQILWNFLYQLNYQRIEQKNELFEWRWKHWYRAVQRFYREICCIFYRMLWFPRLGMNGKKIFDCANKTRSPYLWARNLKYICCASFLTPDIPDIHPERAKSNKIFPLFCQNVIKMGTFRLYSFTLFSYFVFSSCF